MRQNQPWINSGLKAIASHNLRKTKRRSLQRNIIEHGLPEPEAYVFTKQKIFKAELDAQPKANPGFINLIIWKQTIVDSKITG